MKKIKEINEQYDEKPKKKDNNFLQGDNFSLR